MFPHNLSLTFDPTSPEVQNAPLTTRRLSDLHGLFADDAAYAQMLDDDNPVLYTVSAWEIAEGDGDLICGFGTLYPGKVGDEYNFTKGHYHEWREAAEIYIGLSGEGYMLLEHETSGETQFLPLKPNHIVYVPGHTAHRTINTGDTPLTYIGIYSPRAGHDYGALAEKNFAHVVVERDGAPQLMPRADYLDSLKARG